MRYNIPDNYEKYVLYEREEERLKRVELQRYYEELEEIDDIYHEEDKE